MRLWRRRKTAGDDKGLGSKARFINYLRRRENTDADPEKGRSVNHLLQLFEKERQEKANKE